MQTQNPPLNVPQISRPLPNLSPDSFNGLIDFASPIIGTLETGLFVGFGPLDFL